MNQEITNDPDAVAELMWAQLAQPHPNSSEETMNGNGTIHPTPSNWQSAPRIMERSRGSNPVSGTKYAVSSVDCSSESEKGSNQPERNTLVTRQSAHLIGERSGVRILHCVPKFRFKWAEELKCSVGVYVRRWWVETPIGSLRVHHWIHSDDARAFHDHPFWFWTIVLRGGYTDRTPTGNERMKAPKIAFRPAEHAHTVQVDKGGCWTILLTGPQIRKWGFWVGKKWKKSNKYFLTHGVHICD